jgi:hypothetical protein
MTEYLDSLHEGQFFLGKQSVSTTKKLQIMSLSGNTNHPEFILYHSNESSHELFYPFVSSKPFEVVLPRKNTKTQFKVQEFNKLFYLYLNGELVHYHTQYFDKLFLDSKSPAILTDTTYYQVSPEYADNYNSTQGLTSQSIQQEEEITQEEIQFEETDEEVEQKETDEMQPEETQEETAIQEIVVEMQPEETQEETATQEIVVEMQPEETQEETAIQEVVVEMQPEETQEVEPTETVQEVVVEIQPEETQEVEPTETVQEVVVEIQQEETQEVVVEIQQEETQEVVVEIQQEETIQEVEQTETVQEIVVEMQPEEIVQEVEQTETVQEVVVEIQQEETIQETKKSVTFEEDMNQKDNMNEILQDFQNISVEQQKQQIIHMIDFHHLNRNYKIPCLKLDSSMNLNFKQINQESISVNNNIEQENISIHVPEMNQYYLIKFKNTKFLLYRMNQTLIVTNIQTKNSKIVKNKEMVRILSYNFIVTNHASLLVPMEQKRFFDNHYGTTVSTFVPKV